MDPLRTLLPIQATTPHPVEIENRKSKIENSSDSNLENCLDFLSSDATVDRYGEIIDPAGWHLATYQRNPVFQNAHQYGDVIFTLGRALITDVRQLSGRPALYQRVCFAVDANPMARITYNLYKGGFLNAVSVGFIPMRWQNGTEDTPYQRKHLEQELLEVSAVAIPANPNALARAYNSGAVEKSDVTDTIDLLRHISSQPPPSDTPPQSKTENQNSKIPDDHAILHHLRELRSLLKHM